MCALPGYQMYDFGVPYSTSWATRTILLDMCVQSVHLFLSSFVISDYQRKIQPQAHLWQPENESACHESPLLGKGSYQNIYAKVFICVGVGLFYISHSLFTICFALIVIYQWCCKTGRWASVFFNAAYEDVLKKFLTDTYFILLFYPLRIGCGLDRLSWEDVEVMIKEIFHDTNICITVYTLWGEYACGEIVFVQEAPVILGLWHNLAVFSWLQNTTSRDVLIVFEWPFVRQSGDISYPVFRHESLLIFSIRQL